ncbi:hypothetical protein [Janthinobacterium sp. HLX7-2]|uniref:hypothetical protein n=1 Tax=Janthinobacterium sp. HLX7-2 TaxID=1259331 RepID=UPI003F248EB1
MKHLLCLTLAACAALPLAASAANPAPPAATIAAPQEAQAPVPVTSYRSAFDGYRPAAEDDATPDQAWRALNQKVGAAGGHMGHAMKMDGHKMPMPMPQDKDQDQAMPKPADKPATKVDTKVGAQHHHEGH